VDLVVVGFGAAGAATSIAAADGGADVVLLEKQPAEWHTPSTRASGGQCMSVSDVEAATRYMDRCAGGMIPLAVTRAWAERALDVVDFVQNVVGLEMVKVAEAEHPDWDGASAVTAYAAREAHPDGMAGVRALLAADPAYRPAPRPGGGAVLMAGLEGSVSQRSSIQVAYSTAAQRLITDANRRVVGVEARTPEGIRRYRGRCGVVLTCGGYEYNEEMKRSYLRSYPTYFYGSPLNTGDGVVMAQALGADLWHMNSMIGRGIAHFDLKGQGYNYLVQITPGGYVFLDRYGKRFANEHMQAMARHDFYYELMVYDSARAEYPRVPCYWIFDNRRMQFGSPVMGSAAAGPYRYEWSENSEAEIARGWVKKANTPTELFEMTGMVDVAQAVRTLEEYNQACATGNDLLGRPRESLVPIDQPPFYCVELWPGGPNTSGGPRRDEKAQVIDVYGDPIEGLFEAGELGEAVGALYPSNGANISDALCFGRIAAEQALGLQPTTLKTITA
jgi:succinate dehydrogenase/fumarate reductase flavoprotein subunit